MSGKRVAFVSLSTKKQGKRRTSCLPLILVHCALAIRVYYLHANQERLKLGVLLMLLKHLVEFLFIHRIQLVICGHSARESIGVWRKGKTVTHCTKFSHRTTYSGTFSTASCRKNQYLWPNMGFESRFSNRILYTEFPKDRSSVLGGSSSRCSLHDALIN